MLGLLLMSHGLIPFHKAAASPLFDAADRTCLRVCSDTAARPLEERPIALAKDLHQRLTHSVQVHARHSLATFWNLHPRRSSDQHMSTIGRYYLPQTMMV